MSNKVPPSKEGFIPTLNNMGYMTSGLDPFSQEFVDFSCVQTTGLSLEIGAAYGLASRQIVSRGKAVLTNDLDLRHLTLFKNSLPLEQQALVQLLPGDITRGLPIITHSLSAVLACRVFHFLPGKKLISVLNEIRKWLKPKGQLFIVTETPYLKNFSAFIHSFEKRKKEGVDFPGEVFNVAELAPERGALLPDMMHFFDQDTLRSLVSSVGFEIVKCQTFARPDFPKDLQFDGRESVGLVAVKIE